MYLTRRRHRGAAPLRCQLRALPVGMIAERPSAECSSYLLPGRRIIFVERIRNILCTANDQDLTSDLEAVLQARPVIAKHASSRASHLEDTRWWREAEACH